jgi:RNA polymerase sigma-B factor
MRIQPLSSGRQCSDGAHSHDCLVERFLPLARRLAGHYRRYRIEPLDDLVQVASLGLVKAARRYDERRGVSFGAYATSSIEGELKNHLRDHTWALHVPRGAKERALQVNRAVSLCEQKGVAPSTRQLAESLGMTEQDVLDAREAWHGWQTGPLDGSTSEDHSEPQPVSETLGFHDERYELVEKRYTLEAAWRTLPVRERRILHMKYFEDQTQAEIAAKIGVSQMHVSRTLRGALSRLELAIGGACDR